MESRLVTLEAKISLFESSVTKESGTRILEQIVVPGKLTQWLVISVDEMESRLVTLEAKISLSESSVTKESGTRILEQIVVPGKLTQGEEVIAIVPWDEWWGVALKDDSNPQVALLPLHPDMRARFNESASWEFARSMYGKPYGYHNMIFSWIDTMSKNYPPPLDANLVMAAMSMWSRLQPHYASNMWNEALNKRLGTERLDLHGIISETERRGMSFNQLLTIPEQDEWEYSDSKSTACVAFILAMYKAARLFAPFTGSIQVTEFTIRDAYMLRIFEENQTRLPGWCNGDADGLPFCQILGEYKMAQLHNYL